VRRTKPGERTDLECARSRMPAVFSSRIRSWLPLLLIALTACAPSSPVPESSAPVFCIVTLDGVRYKRWTYLEHTVFVPDGLPGWKDGEPHPSWWVPLPDNLEVPPPDNGRRIAVGLSISLHDSQYIKPGVTVLQQLQNAELLSSPPDATRSDWDLVFYRSKLDRFGVEGNGYWIPADSSFRTTDGRRLVMTCSPQLPDHQYFPHRLRCEFHLRITDQMYAQVAFRGTFLRDWKLVYDTAIREIEQRVHPIESYGSPNR
jgi:hypothetical protein